MLKKLLLALVPFVAVSCDRPQKAGNETKLPGKLSTLATICEPLPMQEAGLPKVAHKAVHDPDDWRQFEFVPVANREHLQKKFAELAAFKEKHRRAQGFTDVFLRPEHPVPFENAPLPAAELPRLTETPLGLGLATVSDGFALSDGGEWFIYGERSKEGRINLLAVSPSYNDSPSDAFVRALAQIAGTRYLLVDWYAGVIVDTTSPESIRMWTRRFH